MKSSLSSRKSMAIETEHETAEEVTQSATSVLEKTELNSKQLRQRDFLQAYLSNGYNVAAACRSIGLNRKQYYRWRKSDQEFTENLEIAQEEKIEAIEDVLYGKALNGDTVSCLFYLKCQAKHRGWIEQGKQEIQISKGPDYSQEQLDAMVRGRLTDRSKYTAMLGIDE